MKKNTIAEELKLEILCDGRVQEITVTEAKERFGSIYPEVDWDAIAQAMKEDDEAVAKQEDAIRHHIDWGTETKKQLYGKGIAEDDIDPIDALPAYEGDEYAEYFFVDSSMQSVFETLKTIVHEMLEACEFTEVEKALYIDRYQCGMSYEKIAKLQPLNKDGKQITRAAIYKRSRKLEDKVRQKLYQRAQNPYEK